jgi:2,4-dienoyl-CoA reductase-like NADH-dependent reductase (Old Yellow Enzyme family)
VNPAAYSYHQTYFMVSAEPLFRPFGIHHLALANRIVMAPMTRNFSPGGVPGPDVAAYYRRRAANGVGLVLTEGTAIAHPAAVSSPKVPHFHGADALAGWADVLAGVHAAGGRIMPQLWHVGMMRKPGDEPNPEAPPVGPSGIAVPAGKLSEPLSEAEIDGLIAAYARAAAEAQRLGFDGVELHGAHGYLIDQFFWSVTNQRTDRYGGDVAERTRFAAEAVTACRRAVGPDFPILLRFSQWKIADYSARLAATPDELERFLAPLSDAGVDIFHCSTRRFWEPEFPGSSLNLAGWTKKLSGKPTVTVGSVGLDNDFMTSFREGKNAGVTGLDRIAEMIARDEVDLVAVGRALLADAAWAAKIRDGRTSELQAFNPESMKVLA